MNYNFDNLLKLNNLGEELKQLYEQVKLGNDALAYGLSRPSKLHIASYLDKFVLYVAKDSIDAGNIFQGLQDYYGDKVGLLTANEDLLIYRKTFHKTNVGSRIKTLYDISSQKITCCVTSINAISQYLPQISRLQENTIKLEVGKSYDIYKIIEKLAILGYQKENVVEDKNTFSLVGDILNVFPANYDLPIRISFFDDEIESIKFFEPESRANISEISEIALLPNNEFMLNEKEMQNVIALADRDIQKMSAKSSIRAREILSEISLYSFCTQHYQWLLPYFSHKMSTIFDYLPIDSVVILDEPTILDSTLSLMFSEHKNRVQNLVDDGDCMPSHIRCMLAVDDLYSRLQDVVKLGFSNLLSSNPIFSPTQLFSIKCGRLGNYTINFGSLYDDLRGFVNAGYMVVICAGDSHRADAMQKNLSDENIHCGYSENISQWRHGIVITPIDLSHGFSYPQSKIAIIGREDISKTRTKKNSDKTKVFNIPKVGDYVVHEIHGIGRCLGTNRVKTGVIEQDYIIIEYRKDEKLYVPIDQLDRLSRYSGSDTAPRLSLIGGKDFEKLKESVRKSVKEMAINLVELYAERQKKLGHKYSKDSDWQKQFEDNFIYQETPDQIDAIQDFKSDMERGIIMDRLLCGDVGYGKTEVALRAVFKTIMENKQAIILAPTTILAKQHYNTAKERFDGFGIDIELITRFQTPEQINTSLNNLALGKSLVAIATHRILSKDVSFCDLGLLVLDEEQRFGVEHKESLKLLKSNVNVLTMSATPIPRTLNMALTGIRDISVLETPPHNRLPVQTSVVELTNGLLQDAINRELSRGGQVFVLFNRVEQIDNFASSLASLIPNAKVIVAHGQMDTKSLENRINDFYNREANVLVCTTIIENGIDIANANTLIVCDSDRLGLSQLYQLRGRVGRSNRIAYAYFTVQQGKVLTSNSSKRLNAIMDYTELGSGFKIAMRDLEIRGAGNILGKEQHGHIEKVGYDMYCKILNESIAELQGIEKKQEKDIKVKINIDVYLDTNYIVDENQRLRIYREVLELQSIEQLNKMVQNLKENYGIPPQPTANLIDLGLMKNIAKNIGVIEINISEKGAGLVFSDDSCFKNEAVFSTISDYGDKCLLTYEAQPKLIFDSKWMLNIQKFNTIKSFLLQILKIS